MLAWLTQVQGGRLTMNLSEFFAMGGNGFYVWGAFGVAAVLIAAEIIAVHARLKAARDAARGEDDR
jgi:heme exporter protein CcmD